MRSAADAAGAAERDRDRCGCRAGAVANPVVADAYDGLKDVIRKGIEMVRERAPDAEVTRKGDRQEPPEA